MADGDRVSTIAAALAWLSSDDAVSRLDVHLDSGPAWDWDEEQETEQSGPALAARHLAELGVPVYAGQGAVRDLDGGVRTVNRIGVTWDDVPALLDRAPVLIPLVRASEHFPG